MFSAWRTLGRLAILPMFLALSVPAVATAEDSLKPTENDRASRPSSQVPYHQDQVLFYSPIFGRLSFDSAVICDTEECMGGQGSLAERSYMDLTLAVACGRNVGTEPEAKNAFLETTVTVRKRLHTGSRPTGVVTLTSSEEGGGLYEESSRGASPMATYPCPDPDQNPSRYFSEDTQKTLSQLRDAGYDTIQIERPMATPGQGSAEIQRDGSCVQSLVANWVHGEAEAVTPLCAMGDKGGQVQWAPLEGQPPQP